MSATIIERDGPVGRVASDGKPYITLTQAGEKAEGETPVFAPCPGQAWNEFRQTLMERVRAHAGKVLEWRVRPTLEAADAGYWVRSRLAFVALDESVDGPYREPFTPLGLS